MTVAYRQTTFVRSSLQSAEQEAVFEGLFGVDLSSALAVAAIKRAKRRRASLVSAAAGGGGGGGGGGLRTPARLGRLSVAPAAAPLGAARDAEVAVGGATSGGGAARGAATSQRSHDDGSELLIS